MWTSHLWRELFLLQNYKSAFWNHTWTLALEEHFYILLPLLLMQLVRRNPGTVNPFASMPRLVVGASCMFITIRAFNYAVRTEYSFYTHAWPSHLRMDSLFFGVGVAYAYHFHREGFYRMMRPLRYPLMALVAALLGYDSWGPWPMTAWYYHTIGFTQQYVGAGALITGLLTCRLPENAATRTLAALGAQSYSIYLWHMALMLWAVPHLQNGLSWGWRTALYMAGAFVIGIGMARILELPLLRLRDRWYPSRSSAEPPQAVVASPMHLRPAA